MSEQDFWRRKRVSRAEQQGGYFREGAAQEKALPTTEVRGLEERGDRAGRGGVEETKLEQAEGWMLQEKG